MEEYEILSRKENLFPDDLEGMLNAIANVCNSEPKIATLLHLNNVPANGNKILERIIETVGTNVRLIKESNFSDYCHKSLLPSGIIVKEQVKKLADGSIYTGYRISEAGKNYSFPLAVFSLEWAVDNNLSLYSILGSTLSSGYSRAPLNRLKILKLLKQKELREVDLSKEVRINKRSILKHLRALEKIGFANYDSVPESIKKRGTFKYGHTGKEGEPERSRTPNLTKKVLETIKKIEEADVHEITDRLNYKNLGDISRILKKLEKEGFVKTTGKFKSTSQSTAKITDFGRKFLDEFYNVWEKALSNEPILYELQEKTKEFFENKAKDYLVRGIENHWRVSPMGNKKPRKETNKRIIAYIEEHPGIRPKEIEICLRLSHALPYLTPLVKLGKLEKRQIDENNKTAVGYFVKKPTTNSFITPNFLK